MKATNKKSDKDSQPAKPQSGHIRQGNEDWDEGQEKKGNQNWDDKPEKKPDLRVKENEKVKDIVKGPSSPKIKRKEE
jgi:hypothetical protein